MCGAGCLKLAGRGTRVHVVSGGTLNRGAHRHARCPDSRRLSASARLVRQRLVVLQAVRLVADEQVAGALAAELLRVQPERLVGHNQHLPRGRF